MSEDESTREIAGDAERERVASLWVDGAEEVAALTGDPEAERLVEIYLRRSSVGEYVSQGLRLVAGSTEPAVILVPIMRTEATSHETIAGLQRENNGPAAYFLEDDPGRILLRGEGGISPTWKGLVLLHETFHLDAYESGAYRDDEDWGHWDEEVDAFTREHEWVHAIGGADYDAYMEQMTNLMLEKYDDQGGKGGVTPDIPEGPELDRIFGPAASRFEANLRHTVVHFEAIYRMFDAKYGAEVGRFDKLKWTKMVYGRQRNPGM